MYVLATLNYMHARGALCIVRILRNLPALNVTIKTSSVRGHDHEGGTLFTFLLRPILASTSHNMHNYATV